MPRMPKPRFKEIESLVHDEAKRRNIPTAEMQSFYAGQKGAAPLSISYPRATPLQPGERRERNPDLDPQLVWRGKDEQDWSDLVVHAPPLYIQEKVHPKVIVEDLKRQSARRREETAEAPDLFADFNGLPDSEARLEFYQHNQNWSNRMILGDSLQVMASLAEREGLRGQVQCIYIDPPYGIRFNSNWQVSTRSRDVKDGKADQISREPEQIKAFRDTWKNDIHSYLAYLRDRLTVARDLLADSGSIFVQIGEENVHFVRGLLAEVFGQGSLIREIIVTKTSGLAAADRLASSADYILWFAKNTRVLKFRPSQLPKDVESADGAMYYHCQFFDGTRRPLTSKERVRSDVRDGVILRYIVDNLTKPYPGSRFTLKFQGREFDPGSRWWGTTPEGMGRLLKADRLQVSGNTLRYIRFWNDFPYQPLNNVWTDMGTGGFLEPKIYVVQTRQTIVERCVVMTTDPGDLVLDPTCGSGTTAYVAEQWGRRWITIDTSRVALALARARIMGARYPYYLLADSEDGRHKEAEIAGKVPAEGSTYDDIRQGFVYQRVPHITLKSIANGVLIDIIWEKWEAVLAPLRLRLSEASGQWSVVSGQKGPIEEWEVPRSRPENWPPATDSLLTEFWEARIARQNEIDESIARAADVELLYDKPYADSGKVRVAGPFTVESLSPHRVIPGDEHEAGEEAEAAEGARRRRSRLPYEREDETDFSQIVLEHLRTAGVQQAHKEDRISFTSLSPWPGEYVGAEGRFMEAEREKRAAIFIGPEFGTVGRPDLIAAAREAAEARFDVLIACGFAYDVYASDFSRLGPLPVLRARMNPDLHMADELKNTGAGNLFVVFGEPDVEVRTVDGGQIEVEIKGVDVFDPQTGEVRSGGTDDIAAWFIDTDYDEESFFVRHAYFLGAHDPYKALKTTLKAEIDEEAWASLYRATSRPFPKPSTGRFAVKVINHVGDEVMKVFQV
jgi:adenine-specific DNA-methyltransferase